MADTAEVDLAKEEKEEDGSPAEREPEARTKRKSSGKKTSKSSRSDEEKWVLGGLAVMVPAVALRYRGAIEAWAYDNRLWLIGIAVLLVGSCVLAMWCRHRATRRPTKRKAEARAVFGAEGVDAPKSFLRKQAEASGSFPASVPAVQGGADVGQASGPDEAPALAVALKLDYPSGKLRTVSRGRVELGEEWVIELPPAGVYGDLVSKRERIVSWLDVEPEQFTMRPGPGRQVILLMLDEVAYSRAPHLPDPVQAAARGMLPVGYDMHGRIEEIADPVGKTQILVAGSTGGGKTEWLKWLAYFALRNGYDLVIVDGKGDGDLAYFEKACLIYEEAPSHKRVMEVASFVEAEQVRRTAANSASIRAGSGRVSHRPLVVIFDEISTYTDEADSRKEAAAFEKKTKTVSRKIRSAKGLLVLATQNPKAEVINTSIRANHRVRIAFGCADRDQSDVILGGGIARAGYDASKLPGIEGAAILQVKDKNRELRGLMVSDEDIQAAVDARMNDARGKEPEHVRLVRKAYGEEGFLPTAEFAARLRELGVDISGGEDAKQTGAAVTEWLSEQFGRDVPAVQERVAQGRVRGRWLADILRP